MEYQMFLEYVKDHIQDYLPEEYRKAVPQIKVMDSAGGKREGLTFPPPKGKTAIVPVIWLDPAYEILNKEKISLEECMQKIADTFMEAVDKTVEFEMPDMSKENILKNLFIKAVNIEKSDLEGVPYEQINDLAIIAKTQISENTEMQITDAIAEYLGMDDDEILKAAIENNRKMSPPIFMNITDMMLKLLVGERASIVSLSPWKTELMAPMYVLTNERKEYGASMIAYKDILDEAAKILQSDLYILPSSIHEVLIVPDDFGMSLQELKEMVAEANQKVVLPEDFLSDNVYKYDAKTRELTICTDAPELEKEQGIWAHPLFSGPKM